MKCKQHRHVQTLVWLNYVWRKLSKEEEEEDGDSDDADNDEGKTVPLVGHIGLGGVKLRLHLFLKFVPRSNGVVIFNCDSLQTAGKEPPVPAEKEDISVPRPIWTLGNKGIVGNGNTVPHFPSPNNLY